MKKVLLTGCFGNIGAKVIEEMLLRQYQVRCLDLKNKNNQKVAKRFGGNIEVLWGDITDKDAVQQAIKGVDAVIHNAAMLPPFSEMSPGRARQVNVGGTEHVIKAIEVSDNKPHLIFPSSISIHGLHQPDEEPIRKISDPLVGVDNYAQHKIDCEGIIDNSGIDWTVVRIGACFDWESKIGFDNIKQGMEDFFRVNPHCRIEYIHTRDVATALVNAVTNTDAYGKKLFLGGGDSCRSVWHELNSIRFEAMGLEKPALELFGNEGYYTEWMDTEEAQNILQFQQRTIEDYRNECFEKLKWQRILITPVKRLVQKYLYGYAPNA